MGLKSVAWGRGSESQFTLLRAWRRWLGRREIESLFTLLFYTVNKFCFPNQSLYLRTSVKFSRVLLVNTFGIVARYFPRNRCLTIDVSSASTFRVITPF